MKKNILVRGLCLLTLLTLGSMTTGCAAEPALAADFGTALGHYETIRVVLTEDSLEGVESAATELVEVADAMAAGSAASDFGPVLSQVSSASAKVAEAGDIEAARQAFRALSEAMIEWHAQAEEAGTEVAHCPMAAASWLQPGDEEIGNPYYGSSMLRCGSFVVSKDDTGDSEEAVTDPATDLAIEAAASAQEG